MKIKLFQDDCVKESEVKITYRKMSQRLQRLIKSIRQYEYKLQGLKDGSVYFIPLEELLYAEYVDGHTFLYTEKELYESENTLTELEEMLSGTTVLRISKAVIMNIAHLRCVTAYPNHRLLAELSNGEKTVVSRKYINNLKDSVRRSYHE